MLSIQAIHGPLAYAIDPCTSGWTRNTDGELLPLWFNELHFPDELMKAAKHKHKETPPPPQPLPTPPPQTSRPQRFSALVAKLRDVTELDDDCFAGYK